MRCISPCEASNSLLNDRSSNSAVGKGAEEGKATNAERMVEKRAFIFPYSSKVGNCAANTDVATGLEISLMLIDLRPFLRATILSSNSSFP